MHTIFATEGIVLGRRGVGEANTLVFMLTKDLGLIRASARSSRVEASKLRYGLQMLSRCRFSLVRGRHEWRLVGVEVLSQPFSSALLSEQASLGARRARAGKIACLLLRLIHGEEPVPALFAAVASGFAALSRAEDDLSAEAIESVIVLRVIAQLGYLPQTAALEPFIEGEYSVELSAEALKSRALLVRTINESLSATGL